jgi:hypothetical protein
MELNPEPRGTVELTTWSEFLDEREMKIMISVRNRT